MNEREATRALSELANTFPQLGGALKIQTKGDYPTVGRRWVAMLKHCPSHQVMEVIDDLIHGDIELPDGSDQVLQLLQRESRARAAILAERLEQHEKYHAATKKSGKGSVLRQCIDIARNLPPAIHAQPAEKIAIEKKLYELVAWDKGGEKPDWIGQEETA